MGFGVLGETRRWLAFDVVWLAALCAAVVAVWDRDDWTSPAVIAIVLALTVVLDALSRHYDDTWGLRFTSGSIVALAIAAILLGPAPAALIGAATAFADSLLMRARSVAVFGNTLNVGTVGLVGGLMAEAWMESFDGVEYALAGVVVMVVMDVTNLVVGIGYHWLFGERAAISVRGYSAYLPWILLAGVVVAGMAYGYREGGLGVLVLFAAAVVLCQMLLLRIYRVQGTLRSERDLHRRYLQMVGTAVVSLGPDMRVTFANRRAGELLSLDDAGAAVGRDWAALLGDDERRRLSELLLGERVEDRFDSDFGQQVVAWHATVVSDEGGAASSLLLAGEDVTERRAEERRMEFLAYNDTLTGLPNGSRFEADLAEALDGDRPAALLLVDLDDFKSVNDTYTHEAGDRVLAETAARLRAITGRDDLLARGDSDEFLIWIADLGVEFDDTPGARAAAASNAETVARCFETRFPVTGMAPGIAVSASVSMALFPYEAMQPAELRRVADAAMNGIKQRAATRGY
jgi:diguanylate cyclase (GGDEF)-like protein